MTGRRRPWKVFVHDVGPTFSFATEIAAKRRARELVGEYGRVSVYEVSYEPGSAVKRTLFTIDEERDEHLVEGSNGYCGLAWRPIEVAS